MQYTSSDSDLDLAELIKTNVANAEGPGGTWDCWNTVTRNGSNYVIACSITVNGVEYCCKVVTDASDVNGLATCTT
ncbi:hypothetical protein UMM65_15805 [Aureibaculum sp. 2210JD6-5]|uniref:hypothetical protein n=1 Tax=Aureibaculum sp. 2210JD6-5 TaxID=3103957 RepID=UPI002AAEF024|nr:hypothetical protein [Aureibaculum sp. 2210JD6-5]MDY7396713.1 hypothetical protein [Aureibaculum sp. 2210JD6-5]